MKNNCKQFLVFFFLFFVCAQTIAQTVTVKESRCVNTGEVIFSGNVGAGGPYQLSVINYPSAYTPIGTQVVSNLPFTFNALFPGLYTFKIIDQGGVVFTYPAIEITGSYILPGNSDYTPVAANVSNCIGTISGVMTNGRPPYAYKIIDGPAQVGTINNTGTFTGLPPGNYKVQASDSCQNIQTRDVVINSYTFSISGVSVKIANCDSYSLDLVSIGSSNFSNLHYEIVNYNTAGDSIVRATSDTLPLAFNLFSRTDVQGGRVKIKVFDDCGNIAFYRPLQYSNFVRDTLLRGVINKISCDSFSLESLITQLQFPSGNMLSLLNAASGVVYNSYLPIHFKATRNDISSGNIVIAVIDSCGNTVSTNKIRTTDWSFSQDLRINCDGSVVLNSLVVNGIVIQPYTIKIKAFFKNLSGIADSTSSQEVTSFPYTVTGITGNPNPVSVRIDVTDSCGETRSKTFTRSFGVTARPDYLDCNLSVVNASVIGLYESPVTYSVSPALGGGPNTTGYFELPLGTYTITATDSCGKVSSTILNLNRLWELLPVRQAKSCAPGYVVDSMLVPGKSVGPLTVRQYDGPMPVTALSPLLKTQLFTSQFNNCIACANNDTTEEKIVIDSTLPYHTYSYVVTDSCGNSDTISVTNGAGKEPFYSTAFSKAKCAGGSDIYANWRNDDYAVNSVIVTVFDSLHNQLLQFNSGSNTNMNMYPGGQVLLQNANTGRYTVEYSFVSCPQVYVDTVFSREYVQPKVIGIQSIAPCGSTGNPVIVTATDGVPPYRYEIVDTYPGHYTSPPQTSAVFNLPTSQSTATIRVLDACLNSAILTVAVTIAAAPVIHSDPSPLSTCILPLAVTMFTDSVYDSSVFEWVKLTGAGAGATVISTRPFLTVMYYSIADTGTYRVGVKIPGTCFDTSATFLLNNVVTDCSGLPVTIISFTASAIGADVKLNWLVAEQINISSYIVEWSVDGQYFKPVAVLPATNTSFYSILHTSALEGLNYYRLKIVENNGQIVYSRIAVIKLNTIPGFVIKPNPFNTALDAVMKLNKNSPVTITLTDVAGRQVFETIFNGVIGNNNFTIKNLDKLSKGIYVLGITGDGFMVRKKLLKD